MKLVRLPGTYPVQADTHLLTDVLLRSGLASGRRVLDVATGGGALAVAAAQAGAASVTAVDLSLRSVLTARANARLNGVRVAVRRGDLFAPVSGERFDLVVANPPYVPAAGDRLPRHTRARCWDAGPDGRALVDRLCDGAPRVLAPGGTLLVVQSAVTGEAQTLERLRRAGLRAEVVRRLRHPFGPVLRSRAGLLEARGLITPGQRDEELVVVRARALGAAPGPRATTGWGDRAA